ncbi:hypothetical protein BW13_05765 [Bifidobacterium sp. UTCIF-37]|nr:hypothetical protein BW13_05765 [Bifidobacterium sp. UTCIF-37]TPF88771.1 hypothetical protein BW11_06565 [Bifidobacterium sp. UTCIF-38]
MTVEDRRAVVARVTTALEGDVRPVAIRGARKVDARGVRSGWWVVSDARGVIVASGSAGVDGSGEEAFEHACRSAGIDPAARGAVVDGHARLVSNGAIAGSTLTLEVAVQRAVNELGFAPADAVEAATLTPARAFGFDRPNPVTGAPLGLVAPGYAADLNLLGPTDWTVQHVWCAGRQLR